MKKFQFSRWLLTAALVAMFGVVTACSEESAEDKLHDAGEDAKQSMEDVGDSIKAAGEDVKDKVEDATDGHSH